MAVFLFSSMASSWCGASRYHYTLHQGTKTLHQGTKTLHQGAKRQCTLSPSPTLSVSLVVAPAVCICPGGNITACMTPDGLASTHDAFHAVAVKELPFASHRCDTSGIIHVASDTLSGDELCQRSS